MWHQIGGHTYRAWEEDAILELTEEVGNEEAPQHQAHRKQGSVGVGIRVLDACCKRAVDQLYLCIVQNQRVRFENLYREIGCE